MSNHVTVPKTYKLFVNGAFPRSESGRVYEVTTPKGEFLANAAQASRKDARDAVVAARAAVSGWSGATAYNRGQVLYRVAEVLEGRRAQFEDEIVRLQGVSASAARDQVDEAIAKANNTPYGLSAGIWSDKGSRILAVADKLRAGVIWANTFNRFDPASPFGGYKESGYGREGGRQGLAAYLKGGLK